MKHDLKQRVQLMVSTFQYVANKVAEEHVREHGPAALHAKVNAEAERSRAALRLVQRDMFEMAETGLRKSTLSSSEYQKQRKQTAAIIQKAQTAIDAIVQSYLPTKLAA